MWYALGVAGLLAVVWLINKELGGTNRMIARLVGAAILILWLLWMSSLYR